jgi:hypothetical protein
MKPSIVVRRVTGLLDQLFLPEVESGVGPSPTAALDPAGDGQAYG